jgi:predicted RNase H-like HicB family nuclease
MDDIEVIERADDGSYGAYVPDLPGCVAAGDTRDQAEQLIREAIPLHLASLREHGDSIPQPQTTVTTVTAPAA